MGGGWGAWKRTAGRIKTKEAGATPCWKTGPSDANQWLTRAWSALFSKGIKQRHIYHPGRSASQDGGAARLRGCAA